MKVLKFTDQPHPTIPQNVITTKNTAADVRTTATTFTADTFTAPNPGRNRLPGYRYKTPRRICSRHCIDYRSCWCPTVVNIFRLGGAVELGVSPLCCPRRSRRLEVNPDL